MHTQDNTYLLTISSFFAPFLHIRQYYLLIVVILTIKKKSTDNNACNYAVRGNVLYL